MKTRVSRSGVCHGFSRGGGLDVASDSRVERRGELSEGSCSDDRFLAMALEGDLVAETHLSGLRNRYE